MKKMSENKSVKIIKSKENNEKKQSEKTIDSAMKKQNLNTGKSGSNGKIGKTAAGKNINSAMKKQNLSTGESGSYGKIGKTAAGENINSAMKKQNLNTRKSSSNGKKASEKNEIAGIKKEYLKSNGSCKVTFTLPKEAIPEAKVVNIVGDFNNWNLTETQMIKIDSGDFQATLKLPCDREYRFRYLVDSTYWKNDWCADNYVPNSFGSDDSLLIV
jgi:hypothetical protein